MASYARRQGCTGFVTGDEDGASAVRPEVVDARNKPGHDG